MDVGATAAGTLMIGLKLTSIYMSIQDLFGKDHASIEAQAQSTTAGAGGNLGDVNQNKLNLTGHEVSHQQTESGKIVTNAGKIFDATKLFDNYKTGNAKEEANAGRGNSQDKWEELSKQNGCAISMSYCLNSAGYIIDEHRTNRGRLTTTGNIKRENNNNKPYEYILSATEMGGYLKEILDEPTLYLERLDSDNLDEFIKKLAEYKNFKAIIYLKAGDPSEYGRATGHIDLLYEDWGGDAALKGVSEELDDYLES
jgi:hypothetical protein